MERRRRALFGAVAVALGIAALLVWRGVGRDARREQDVAGSPVGAAPVGGGRHAGALEGAPTDGGVSSPRAATVQRGAEAARAMALVDWRREMDELLQPCIAALPGERSHVPVVFHFRREPVLSTDHLQRFVCERAELGPEAPDVTPAASACLGRARGTSLNLLASASELAGREADLELVYLDLPSAP